ncbi:protein SFI1 [Pseudoscourfieldia marina]
MEPYTPRVGSRAATASSFASAALGTTSAVPRSAYRTGLAKDNDDDDDDDDEGRGGGSRNAHALSTGDVVSFTTLDGQPYVAFEEPSDDAPGDSRFVLRALGGLTPQRRAEALSARASHLEVFRQGKWIGFRCAAAGDKYLQATRRSHNRLCFQNVNFGIWEHFEIASDEPTKRWTKSVLSFRSRRLPQYVLRVEVVRSGIQVVDVASFTPVSLPRPQREDREGVVLSSVSGVVMKEWHAFVSKEVAARQHVEGKMARLQEEASALRQELLAAVGALRAEARGELERCMDAVGTHEKRTREMSGEAARLQAEAEARMRWGVGVLHRNKFRRILKATLLHWYHAACYNAREERAARARERRCRRKIREIRLRSYCRAWRSVEENVRTMRSRLVQCQRRVERVRTATRFRKWREMIGGISSDRAMGALRAQFRNRVANQVVRRLMYRRISVCFDKWRGIWQEKMRRRMKVRKCLIRITQSQANRALNAWRFYVAERSRRSGLASRAQIVSEVRRMHYSFKGWVDYVEHLAQMHQYQVAVIVRLRQLAMQRVVRAWMNIVRVRKEKLKILGRAVRRMLLRPYGRLLRRWLSVVVERERKRHVLRLAIIRIAKHHAMSALRRWREVVRLRAESRDMSRVRVIRIMTNRMGMAWNKWLLIYREAHNARATLHKALTCMIKSTVAKAFRRWSHFGMERLNNIRSILARMQNIQLHRAFESIRANRHQCRRARANSRRLKAKVRVIQLRSTMQIWRRWNAIIQKTYQSAYRVVRAIQRRTLYRSYNAWVSLHRENIRRRAKVRKSLNRLKNITLFRAYNSWQFVTEEENRRRAVQLRTIQRMRHLQLHRVFNGYRATVLKLAIDRRVVSSTIMRMLHRTLHLAFHAWKFKYLAMCKEGRDLWSLTTFRMHRLLKGLCFKGWLGVRRYYVRSRVAVRRYKLRKELRTKSMVLLHWEMQLAYRKHLDHAFLIVADRHRRHAIRNAFQVIKYAAMFGSRQKKGTLRLHNLGQKLYRRHCHLRKYHTFKRWCMVHVRKKNGRIMMRMMHRRRKFRMGIRVLRAWRHQVLVVVRSASRLVVRQARRAMNFHRANKVFKYWRDEAMRFIRSRGLLRKAASRLMRSAFYRCLVRWREIVAERKRKMAKMHNFLRKWQNARLAQYFACWLEKLEQRRERIDRVRRALGKMRRSLEARSFETWRSITFRLDWQRNVARGILNRVMRNHLSRAMNAWLAAIEAIEAWRLRISAVLLHMKASGMARTFNTWRNVEMVHSRYRGIIFRAQNMRILKAFMTWKEKASLLAHDRLLMLRSVHFFTGYSVAMAFNAWRNEYRSYMDERARLHVLYVRTLARFTKLELVSAFASWYDRVATLQTKRASLKRSMMHIVMRSQSRAYACWHELWFDARRRRHLVTRSLSRFKHRHVSAAWMSWQEAVGAARRRLDTLDKCVRRMGLVRVLHAYQGWRERVLERLQAVAKRRAVVYRILNRRLARAFESWMENLRRTRERRAVLYRATMRISRIGVARSFTTWKEALADLKDRRSFLRTQLLRVMKSKQYMCMIRWRGWIVDSKRLRGVASRVVRRMANFALGRAFDVLRAFASGKRRARSLALRAVMRMKLRVVSIAFDTWRKARALSRSNRTAVMRAWRRRDRSASELCFGEWKELLMFRIRRKETVRHACLRKKYGMRFFMRWYWDNLDEDVQVALREILAGGKNQRAEVPVTLRPGQIHRRGGGGRRRGGGGGGFDFFTPDGGGGGGGGGRVDVFMTPGHELVQEGAVAY